MPVTSFVLMNFFLVAGSDEQWSFSDFEFQKFPTSFL